MIFASRRAAAACSLGFVDFKKSCFLGGAQNGACFGASRQTKRCHKKLRDTKRKGPKNYTPNPPKEDDLYVVIVVANGNFWLAFFKTSFATFFGIPPFISNKIRPGLTGQTQYWTLPLPLPIRVLVGFWLIGLEGKIRIQIIPIFLICRIITRRAASIWEADNQPASKDFNP